MSTILTAEDDEAIRGLLVRLLRHAGYDTVDCANGAVALEQARRSRRQHRVRRGRACGHDAQ